jgi:BlaI family transcriptional regulator, penicillinase repressor
MRKKATDVLTQTEWKIMKILWDLKSAPAREVFEIAGQQYGWAPTTVKTILSKLVDKGFLKAKDDGKKFIYRPAQPAIDTLTKAADDFIEKSSGPVQGQLLCYMANKIQLTDQEINELQSILDQHKDEEN